MHFNISKSLLCLLHGLGAFSLQAQLPASFHPSLNGLQFYNNSAIENFKASLKDADSLHSSILFIGGESVRKKILSKPLQQHLQDSFGNGGKGLFFPFSIIHMTDPADYSSRHSGTWLYAKNVEAAPEMATGISCATVKTIDPNASFSIHFATRGRNIPQKLRLFFLSSQGSFDLELIADGVKTIHTCQGHPKNFMEILLPAEPTDLEFRFRQSDPGQKSFELYGLSLENADRGGIVLHHSGMVGQNLSHILSEELLKEQLRIINPRLIFIDLEANEFYKKSLNIFNFQRDMVRCIQLLRRSLPEVEIVLLSATDVKRSNLYLDDARKFSEQIRIMSHTQNCIFYDWYWIAGGPYSIEKWHDKGMAEKWLTGLNDKGMALKAESLQQAVFRTYHLLKENPRLKSLVYNIDSIKLSRVPIAIESPRDSSNEHWQYHKVLHGQTLYGIAAMYGVTMNQVIAWNHLISRVLYSGQVLKIESNKKPVVTPPPRNTKPPVKAIPVLFHTVKKGETLFSIAKKYGTTSTKLMQLNNLKNSRLGIGQKIRVK